MGTGFCCCGRPLLSQKATQTLPRLLGKEVVSVTSYDPPARSAAVLRTNDTQTSPQHITSTSSSHSTYRSQDNNVFSCLKSSISSINPLKFIEGYLHEPLQSLEQALDPFHLQIHRLAYYIKEAKTKCHFPSEHGLTRDESAAIYIYTMQWTDRCLHDWITEAWSYQSREKMKPWFKYLKLFKTAIDKLPDVKEDLWQIAAFKENFLDKFNSESSLFYTLMGGCSESLDKINYYCDQNGDNYNVKELIRYSNADGKLIAGYSENSLVELLIWPGYQVRLNKIRSIENTGQVVYYLIKILDPPKPRKHFVCANPNKHIHLPRVFDCSVHYKRSPIAIFCSSVFSET